MKKPALDLVSAITTATLAVGAVTGATLAASHSAEIDDLHTTIDGQYEINADYADQIASLTDQLADSQQEVRALREREPKVRTKTVTKQVPVAPKFYEDGSWVAGQESGCAPSALCDDEYQDSLIEHVPSGLATWDGFRVGEVILCPKGWTASVDQNPDGTTWAACM